MIRKVIPALALVAAACGSAERPVPVAAPPGPPPTDAATPAPVPGGPADVVSGIAIFSPAMSFRPCSGPIVSFVDSTSNRLRPLIGLLGSTEAQGVFVIGLGVTSPRNELVLREVDYAVRPAPGEGCERPEQDYTVGIRGVDSAWQVMIAPAAIEYRDPAGSETIRFPAAAPAETGETSTYASTTEFGAPHSIRIVLTPGSCRETGNGAWSPLQATVTLDEKTVRGCAWRGTRRQD